MLARYYTSYYCRHEFVQHQKYTKQLWRFRLINHTINKEMSAFYELEKTKK